MPTGASGKNQGAVAAQRKGSSEGTFSCMHPYSSDCSRMVSPLCSHCDPRVAPGVLRGAAALPRHPHQMATEVSGPRAGGFPPLGSFQGKAYKNEPRDIPELKAAVRACVRAVSPQEYRRVLEATRRRAERCLARSGGHFEHLL